MNQNFYLTKKQLDLVNKAASFTKEYIYPEASLHDKEGSFPKEIIIKANRAGLLNINIPKKYGGRGMSIFDRTLIAEELAYGCSGIAAAMMVHEAASLPIIHFGTLEQKEKWLGAMTNNELGSLAVTEPLAGSDILAIETIANRNKNNYIINGTKTLVSNIQNSSFFVTFAKLTNKQNSKQFSLFIIEKDREGFIVNRTFAKMGQRASDLGELIIKNISIPIENRIGKEEIGLSLVLKIFNMNRSCASAIAIGIARRALDEAIKYASKRKSFGKPIWEQQAIGHKLSEMATNIDAARLLNWRAAIAADNEETQTQKYASMAKAFSAEVAMRVCVDSVQIFGGYGVLGHYPVEKLMRDVKLCQIYEGTTQIQNTIILKELMK